MVGAATDYAAFAEAVVFLSYFNGLWDPRQPGKVTYPLDEVLLLCLLAVLAGAECFTEIALFGTKKLALLRRFRPFRPFRLCRHCHPYHQFRQLLHCHRLRLHYLLQRN